MHCGSSGAGHSCQCFVREHCVFWRFLACPNVRQMVDQVQLHLFFLPQRAQRIREGRKNDHGSTTACKAKALPVVPPIQLFPHSVRSEILVKRL